MAAEVSTTVPRRESIKAALMSQTRRRSSAAQHSAKQSKSSSNDNEEEDLGSTTSGENEDNDNDNDTSNDSTSSKSGANAKPKKEKSSENAKNKGKSSENPSEAESESGVDNQEDEDDAQTIGDYNPQLMAYLENSDGDSFAIATSSEDEKDDKENVDLDDDLDESQLEAEEEKAIRSEMKRKTRGPSIPGPVSLRRLSQSHARNPDLASKDDQSPQDTGHGPKNAGIDNDLDNELEQNLDNDNDDDSEDANSESSSWGNDFLEDYFDQNNQVHQMPSSSMNIGMHGDENDDTYLWQYFFSSDEDEAGNANPLMRSKQRRASRSRHRQQRSQNYTDQFHGFSPSASRGSSTGMNGSSNGANGTQRSGNHLDLQLEDEQDDDGSTDDDLPLKGRGPSPGDQLAKLQQQNSYVPSGDSTDEDDGVPPERKRKRARGSKAIEVLGSNSFSARPPLLGSWQIRGDKNVGIIDGLTTRTLSPPPVSSGGPHSTTPSGHSTASGSGSAGSTTSSGAKTPQGSGETPRDPFEGLGDHDFTDFSEAQLKGSRANSNAQSPVSHILGLNGDDTVQDNEAEVSDLDLLELGDFINTENMSSDDNNQVYEFDSSLGTDGAGDSHFEPHEKSAAHEERTSKTPTVSPYLYRNRLSSRNAPLAAFRNQNASPYVNNPAYPADNYSPAPRRRRSSANRRPVPAKDWFFSPYSTNKKRSKKMRTGSSSTPRSALATSHSGTHSGSSAAQTNNGIYDFGANDHDFIGELIEIGAISPLYEDPLES